MNPQLENGYLSIAIELAQKFSSYHLSGNEWLILWVVLRKTWGWHKKEDAISLSQFEKETGLSRPSVKEAIDKLVGKKVLLVGKKVLGNVYSFNKMCDDWIVGKKVLVGFSVKTSRVFGKSLVGKKVHTIDILTKDTNTKDITTEELEIFIQWWKERNNFPKPTLVTQSLVKNWEYWRKIYSIREMKLALVMLYGGDDIHPEDKNKNYWKKTITPEILLRTKDRSQQPVDRIGKALNDFKGRYKLEEET